MAFLNVLQLFQKVLTSLPGVEQVLKRRYSSQRQFSTEGRAPD